MRIVERNVELLSEDFDPVAHLRDHLTGGPADRGRDVMRNLRWRAANWLVDRSGWLDEVADAIGIDPEGMPDDELKRTIQRRILDLSYNGFDQLPDELFRDLHDWADGKSFMGRDPNAPSWAFMDHRSDVDDGWLVHFSDDARRVCDEGFRKGVGDATKLGLTGHLHPDERRREGYNFAFAVDDVNEYAGRDRSSEWKYGSEAVVFRADGVKVWHWGDREPQVIFWGPDARDMTCIFQDPDGKWYPEGEPETTFASPGAAARYVRRTS